MTTGAFSKSTIASSAVPSTREWNLYSVPLIMLGTLSMHRSSVPASLFLKLPAIMLHISPSASSTSRSEAVSPNIPLAIRPAVFVAQHTVTTPQSAPAIPTMAVRPPCSLCSDGSARSTWQPSMISKTSCVARSRIGSQSFTGVDLANAVSAVMVLTEWAQPCRRGIGALPSALELQTHGNRRALKQQDRFHGTPLSHRMETVFFAADDGGHAQHASFIRAGELVFEITRDHVADFSERVPYLFWGGGGVAEHFFGQLGGRCWRRGSRSQFRIEPRLDRSWR